MKYQGQRLPKLKELAKYLGVTEQAVKQYPKEKRLLMLLGLLKKEELDNRRLMYWQDLQR